MTHLTDNSGAELLLDTPVIDTTGQHASVISVRQADDGAHAWLQLANGTRLQVPTNLLRRQADGSCLLPFAFEAAMRKSDEAQLSLPVLEETLQVDRRRIDTGGVRIRKTIDARDEVVDPPLLREEIKVEHVPIGRVVTELPQTHYEGDTLVVPVLEEVLVVQKQMLLKEEVRITRQTTEVQNPQHVTLRTEQIAVERFGNADQP